MTTHGAEVNWAVIGTGFISQSIADDLRLTPGARRQAVCSRDPDRARAFAADRGFAVAHGSVAALLDDSTVDAVYIATPHSTHAAIAIAALEAGKHVLIEKPMAVSAEQGRQIARAAAATGLFAMEAMWMRFNPAYRDLVAAARSGAIGEVRSVRASFGLPFGPADSTRWTEERASSTLLDQGIYPVTLALDVLGRPSRIRATGRVRDDGVDLTVHATFEYEDHRFAQLSASMVEYIEPTASASGSDGWMTVPAPFWAADEFTTRVGSIARALTEQHRTHHERRGNGYVPMLEAVTLAIAEHRTEHPTHSLADSIATLEVLDAVRHSLSSPTARPKETR
ncbi:Gfo/Idh/MocA family protein [Microbacterium hydrocarbonoxydans]|uniref:Predicted dehydrogenase n=1 Tax=Microbacterium hydrocarbonoxydans TaxID=273678 RepID=A0A1H4JHK5_9MICO|nr:Gfo/Idh/MocA family oxidoreductase [Microbacterium hydrocarbonoxydans]SEB45761.1 Predicted dehydrogenase [Microbacterium hydrocarbonoxydans]